MKNQFGKKMLSSVISLILALSAMPGAMAEKATQDEYYVPGVVTATELEEAPIPEVEAIKERIFKLRDTEKEILIKYLGSAELTREETYAVVSEMSAEEMDAAYAELVAYANTLTEEEIVLVPEVVGYFEQAILDEQNPELFANEDLYFFDNAILVDVDGNGTGSAPSANSFKVTTKGSLLGSKTTTVNIYNETTDKILIKFDYTLDKANKFVIDGNSTLSNGSFSKGLAPDEGIALTLTSNSGFSNLTATLNVSNLSYEVVADTSDVTFSYDSSLGSITVGGEAVASGTTLSISSREGTQVTATPKSGVTFLGWANAETGMIYATDGVLKPDGKMTLRAIFAGKNACFGIGDVYLFDDLNKAISVASNQTSKIIHLANSGTLSAGTYTIPAGVTLLIPYNAERNCYTNVPGVVAKDLVDLLNRGKDYISGDYTTPTVYRTLTMANGAKLVINGALSVSNRIFSGNAGMRAGSPTGPISRINMESGSNITVNNSAKAYVYGFIYGNGTMNVKSGATVYECMQILDFRGGDATTDMAAGDNRVFPFTQYYVQNIEVSTYYEGGSTEAIVSSFTISKMMNMAEVPFIASSGAMFTPGAGTTFEKRFDPATGKTIANVNGDISMSPLKVSLGSTNLDTSKFVLPIASNLTININSGTGTINQDIALLPSAELNVGKDATLVLAEGRSAYAYDLDDWVNKNFIYKRNDSFSDGNQSWLTYTATTTSTKRTLTDSKIDVNGKILGNGFLYTTAGGAQVFSSQGTGVVELVNWDPTAAPVTYQAVQGSDGSGGQAVTDTAVPVTSVKLMNANGTYTETVNTAAGIEPITGKFLYNNGKWEEWRPGVYFDANGGEGTMAPQYCINNASITLAENAFTRAGYNFIGWSLTADGGVDVEDKANMGIVEEELTLYAVWEKAVCEHKNTEPAVPAEAPTCTKPGTTEGLKCSDCQETIVEPEEIPVDENAHSFTKYEYNNDSKCGVDGTKTAICDHGCGATETVTATGTALSHSFTKYVSDNNATKTEDGTKTAVCDHGCGAKDTVVDVGSRTGLKNINLTYAKANGGHSFSAIVEGYKGTGRLYVAIYNAQGKVLSVLFAPVNADNSVDVNFGAVADASYAKVFAWDGTKAVATYKIQQL